MPQKRNIVLQPLSREHHFALLLGWKINEGLRLAVEIDRINRYLKWFSKAMLFKHFAEEETHLFPILGEQHPLVLQAKSEHKKMVELLSLDSLNSTQLAQFANILKDHIRFEERELYNEIQRVATVEMLASLENIITHTDFIDNIEDEFWVEKTKI